ncbi:NAD(P)/FAD-dependent oxidoreductase [uncultured Paracoccus sp.]|uniref:NAD(P)/FAD-dependent oxidoreductase n=1 Tax=uncultured Paracoccus sp. TaxID=189685 RepID=UPI002639CC30|nr:NAD(P)/FAD-dependent oxidoreductase [uncultured Paracoccus sp.]
MTALRSEYDLVVVGAGPAGIAAAAEGARAGVSTLLLDENAGPGGQVWRGLTSTPLTDREMLGRDFWDGLAELQKLRDSGAEVIQRATVWSIDPALQVGVSHGGASQIVQARRVIIATGAMERPFPIPGWTLPGVMTAGAAQTVLKSSGLVPSTLTVIAGQGPLLWLLAGQILRMGGRIDLMLDTTPKGQFAAAIPKAWGFLTTPYFRKGLKMLREVRSKVRVIKHVSRIEAEGDGRLERVIWETAGGRRGDMAAALLLLHQGVVPNVNLAMAAGAEHDWDRVQLCWRPRLDDAGHSTLPGLYIAGDGAGIGGVGVALARGRVAAHAALAALGQNTREADLSAARAELTRANRGRAFLDLLYRPADNFRIPEGDTVVCRCEEIRARDVLAAVDIGATGPNQLKAYLRAGMGPCQGRMCGLTVTELMAKARGTTPEAIGHYRLRAPVKPLTLSELADLPMEQDAVKAVVR